MFGHDTNQNDNQGNVTLPNTNDAANPDPAADMPVITTAPSLAEAVVPASSPTPATDNDLGGFLPSQDEPATNSSPASGAATDDLLDIKQEALQSLSPLLGHLDQTPEEKFRTTMMMIQASDDHSLVKAAYEAAKGIVDEKERAQALLDIVNEINYFTQHPQTPAAE